MKAVNQSRSCRPDRWDEPLDARMSDSDIAWLRSREPFASLDEDALGPQASVADLLRGDTKLHRCEPGQIIARQGDYASSAYLVLAGEVGVFTEPIAQEHLGRNQQTATAQPPSVSRWNPFGRFIHRWSQSDRVHPTGSETRQPSDVVPNDPKQCRPVIKNVDGQPVTLLPNLDEVLSKTDHVTLGPLELFDEIAAFYRSPRSATAVAKTETTLLEIRWQGLKFMLADPLFADQIDQHYRDTWLEHHLRQLPMMKSIPAENISRIAQTTIVRSYGRETWNHDYQTKRNLPAQQQLATEPLVVAAGSIPTELIVIRSGFARLSRSAPEHHEGRSELTTSYLGAGKVFGLDEILFNATRSADVAPRAYQNSLRAIDVLDTLQIPVETFAAEVLPFLDPSIEQNRHTRNSHANENVPSGLVEFIISNRLHHARQAMVIDLQRCTQCDDCVKACASIHDGNSRFTLAAPSHERFQITNACMQCNDPVCMIGCPTGAITRNAASGLIDIHESMCIGCGLCATSCPIGSIMQVPIHAPDGKIYVDAVTEQPIQKAAKCDLCSDIPSGPACQNACRFDALERIDLVETPPLEHWLHERERR